MARSIKSGGLFPLGLAMVQWLLFLVGLASSFPEDLFSNISLSNDCLDGHCEVPAGHTWILDQSVDVKTLKVFGTVKWDTEKDGLELRAGYILVAEGGYFQVGSRTKPMELSATIYIKRGSESHQWFGDRFLASEGEARVEIHGRRLKRTWTLLARTAEKDDKQLFLKHDPLEMGWRIGDHIGLATTSRGQSPERRIVDISPATVWRLDLHNATAGVEREAASNTIDGLLNTEWSSWCAPYCTGAGDEHWLEVQLAALSEVSHVKLYWHAERYAPVSQVEVCEDRCRGVLATVGDLDLRSFKHSEPQVVKLGFQGTHIRVSASFEELKVRATPHWAGLLLYEIRAYGKEVNVTAPVVLHLDNGLSNEHWGGFREVEGYSLEMAAEVVNLNRSVVITGDHDDFKLSRKGLHTISAHGGVMDVRYTRIEYCGQQNHMGKYCLHFHHAGQCADCVFMGNTIYESAQVGITVHGTHRSLVENNILWDTAAAGIYIEDGNEMFNTLSNNVIICTWHAKCTTPWDVQLGNVAGIYMIGMTNNVIENRVAGFENCIWTIGSIALQGQGQALGRVCPQHTPFGTFRGNVCHDNNRFGIYLDNQMPRNLERDSNGFVVDMGSCGEFTQDGRDNGLSPANVIEDQFDWHNDFVGQYSMGDVAFLRFVSVNNAHDMYWKESKNFADGVSHHIKDSLFLTDPNDDTVLKVALIAGPAGPFTFRITNTTFGGGHLGCGAICAGQHCGLGGAGGPCNVQYLLSGVDFSKVHPGDKKIVFGISTVDLGYVQPIFLAEDDSLGGYRSMVSKHLNGFAKLPGCQVMGEEWDEAVACGGHVRRLNLWSANLGDLNMYGPGYDVEPTLTPVVKGMNAGKLLFEPMHGGYGAVVVVGQNYSLKGDFRGDISTELSDVILAKTFDLEETLHLTIGNETCKVSVQDDRSWLGVRGPAPWTSPRVSCLTRAFEANYLTNGGTTTSQPTTTTVTGTSGSCALESEVPCCPDGSCADRCTGSQCCPSSSGTVTCPSSSSVQISTCDAGKRFDCTGNTGVAPPGRLEGNCEFPNPPAIAYYWEPFCFLGKKGCFADGVNVECRFCGSGDFADVTCNGTGTTTLSTVSTTSSSTSRRTDGECQFPNPPLIQYYWEPDCFLGMKGCLADGSNVECRFCGSGDFADVTCITTTTTTTTTSGACSVLTGVQKSCSEDGCTVLTGGMLSRTCRQYCEEHSLICVAAWEDSNDDCNVLASLTCDQTYQGTPDLICQCAPQPPPPVIWIQNQDGLCLMAKDFNISGAAVNLHPCGPESVPSEQWIHHPSTGQLTNANELTRCLHAAEQDVPGALLVMLPCSAGSPAQNFTLDDATRQIRISSGLCLEWLPGGEWMTVVTAVCGVTNQMWYWGEDPVATTTTVVPGWTETAWGPPSASVTGLLQHSGGLCAHQTNQSLTMAVCEPGSSQWFTYNESLRQISAGGLCLASSISSSGGIALGSCNESLVTQFAFNLQSGMIWNRQMQCLEAAVPLVEGSLVHLRDCNRSQEGQRWLFNSAATTTQAPVSVGLHIKLDSGLCLASKENSSRSCLELRGCQEADQAQKWFYDETSNQLKNGWDRCLAAPHAGGILQAKIAFAPVRGGIGRACRGSSWRDNDRSNYIAFWPVDLLEVCKERCRERASCTGIEFNAWLRRCEVWIKPVTTSVKASNFTCYNASLEDPTLAIFEDVDGGADRVCRGKHSGDNSASYYTASLAESKEDCQRQCSMATGRCTGFEYHQFGRCELWSAPVGSSREASGYYCRALATVITQDCNVSDVRQSWRLDSARKILSVQDGACLDAVGGTIEGDRVRLLTCNAESQTQLWSSISMGVLQEEVHPKVVTG
ncbi:Cell surface hyaluronidase (Cell migration-inducing hyaluronidase 2) (Transmembrane protein 2) [Durusdinium trenchii]|uniref:Cell surface hyaluronidase (Cell migration-inducing hyaluronidase 2) (Transmembrane protein 2) n=2 Tax=Durusdinium trenchii TaxID=1381693 RepID=A0ABP0N5L2_9DINO